MPLSLTLEVKSMNKEDKKIKVLRLYVCDLLDKVDHINNEVDMKDVLERILSILNDEELLGGEEYC